MKPYKTVIVVVIVVLPLLISRLLGWTPLMTNADHCRALGVAEKTFQAVKRSVEIKVILDKDVFAKTSL